MLLPSKRFDDFVSSMAASWATAIGVQPVLPTGDPTLAMFEAVAGQLLFLQAQVQLVNAVARAQTSVGADLDTFYGQFGFKRLPGVAATGSVTFAKLTPAATPVNIPAATVVQTLGGAITYTVVADTGQPTWSASQNAYVLPTGGTSLTATVQATAAGTAYNVAKNQLVQIAATVPGIDTVTNPAAITNGINPESDTAYSLRFVLWLNSLSKAILPAIEAAVQSVQQGLIYNIVEQQNFYNQTMAFTDDASFSSNGPIGVAAPHFDPGNFYIVVDDGSGSPPQSLITNVFNAVNAVRGFTIRFQVFAPIIVTANVSLSITTAPGADHPTAVAAVQTAIQNYINGLSLKASSVPLTRLAQVAYDASVNVVNVPLSSITINNLAADLQLSAIEVPRAGVISVI
jgi:hypothetical protein